MDTVRAIASIALFGHGIYQYEHDPSAALYVPYYVLTALLTLQPMPQFLLWRFLSALSVVAGGLYMLFLAYVFHGLDNVQGLQLVEGQYLLPVAVAVTLVTSTRLSHGYLSSPIEYIKGFILTTLLFASFACIVLGGVRTQAIYHK